MSLPTRATLEDIQVVCKYLATKPTGVTLKEAQSIVDSRHLHNEKLTALKFWELIDEPESKLKLTPLGRKCAKTDKDRVAALIEVIRKVPPYNAIIEGAAYRKEDAVTATEVAAHWHEHFSSDVGDSDEVLNAQVICFFNIASGAEFGTLIIGRRGSPTRFSFSVEALNKFIQDKLAEIDHTVSGKAENNEHKDVPKSAVSISETEIPVIPPAQETSLSELGQAIFVAHGKNKKPLEQLKRILDQFKIPYKVAIDEPNLGRPISGKVREIMKSCNCAILIFTADEEFYNKDNKPVWRPSENIVHELGASGYLYDNRIVIMKEERVDFPSNFSDIGYISFETDQLEAKALDILKELIGFGIVKVST